MDFLITKPLKKHMGVRIILQITGFSGFLRGLVTKESKMVAPTKKHSKKHPALIKAPCTSDLIELLVSDSPLCETFTVTDPVYVIAAALRSNGVKHTRKLQFDNVFFVTTDFHITFKS